MRRILKVFRKLRPKPDHEVFESSNGALILPPKHLRFGGVHFKINSDYVDSGIRDLENLKAGFPLGSKAKILDFGCGTGRLATGIKAAKIEIDYYCGIDVSQERISFARSYLSDAKFEFLWYNSLNERYNSRAEPHALLPVGDNLFDAVFSYSVFSHFGPDDTSFYLSELKRVLKNSGGVMLTAFLRDGPDEYVENPADFTPAEISIGDQSSFGRDGGSMLCF